MLPFAPIETYGQRIKKIGEGTDSNVYATDLGFALKVVKNIPIGNIPYNNTISEITALQKINSRYVIPLLDVILEPEETALVFPLAEMSLREGFTKLPLDPKRTVREMCLGLAAVHNADLLHLDIKAQNYLVFPGGNINIIDLGLSNMHTCAFPALRAGGGITYYTLLYRPLEVIFEAPITDKSDVWALGVLLAEYFIYKATGVLEYLFPGEEESEHILDIVTLLGSPPKGLFRGKEANRYAAMNLSSENAYDFFLDKGLSEEEIGLILPMLDVIPSNRPSIFEVLESDYFSQRNLRGPVEWTCFEKLQADEIDYPEDIWKRSEDRGIYIRGMIRDADKYLLMDSTLALGVYIFDVSIVKFLPDVRLIPAYALCSLYIANMFYVSNYDLTLVSVLYLLIERRNRDENGKKYTLVKLKDIVMDILRSISFDLSPVIAYIYLSRVFLERPEIKREATKIWKDILPTTAVFGNQLQLADTILLQTVEN